MIGKVHLSKIPYAITLILSASLLFQNCSQVKFSTLGSTGGTGLTPDGGSGGTSGGGDGSTGGGSGGSGGSGGGTGGGPGSCIPSINVNPQLVFVPSSFDAGQTFSVSVANAALYSAINVDFGDGTTPVTINPTVTTPTTHVYTNAGTYKLTSVGTELSCQSTLSGSQTVTVGACIPNAATLQTNLIPTLPMTPAPVAPFSVAAIIQNGDLFSSPQWLLSGTTNCGCIPAGYYTDTKTKCCSHSAARPQGDPYSFALMCQ